MVGVKRKMPVRHPVSSSKWKNCNFEEEKSKWEDAGKTDYIRMSPPAFVATLAWLSWMSMISDDAVGIEIGTAKEWMGKENILSSSDVV
jgi:hypothetical protein